MRVLIVEDEVMAQQSLARSLRQEFSDMRIVGTAGSVREAVDWLRTPGNTADVIFMDVELSDGDCFEIFRQAEIRAQVVMTTAYDQYAVKAFEVESIDYLLKPVDEQALKRAMERCISRISKGVPGPRPEKGLLHDTAPRHAKERFLVKINDTIVPVKTDEIAWFYSEDKTTWLVTFKGRKYVVDFSLDIAMDQLNPQKFFRISRNCIISMQAISSIMKIGSRLKIESAPASPVEMMVSRSRTEDFLRWLEGR